MRTLALVKAEEGFTIQELLVTIVAGSLLVGFGFSLYLFAAKLVHRDLREREHKVRVLRTVALVASDIEGASIVAQRTDSTLELTSAAGGTVSYSFSQGVLLRGDVAVGPPEGERWALLFQSPSPGKIELVLKSSRGGDSLAAHAEVQVPISSAVKFSAKELTGEKDFSPRGIMP